MLADLLRPSDRHFTNRRECAGHRPERCEVLAHARRVTGELGGEFGTDAKPARDLHRVNVRAEEDKRPARFLLLLHHRTHLIRRVARARVLHSVGRDDEHGACGAILGAGVLVHVLDVVDCVAHRIEQCRAATRIVLLRCECGDIRNPHAIVDDLVFVIEEHGRDEHVPALAAMLREHAVEPADGVALQSRHRPAPIQNEYELRLSVCLFLSHDVFLLYTG